MSFTILNSKDKKYSGRQISFVYLLLMFLACALISAALTAYGLSKFGLSNGSIFLSDTVTAWQKELQEQNQQVEQARGQVNEKMSALALKVADIQAQMIKLDALGEHLIGVAKLDSGEFDFSEKSAVGGPEELAKLGEEYQKPEFVSVLDDISLQIRERAQQMDILEEMLSKQNLKDNAYLAGSPVEHGWLSSHYGYRVDPFTGKLAWHKGVDFSGKKNSPVLALASGIVTWSGEREGYGNMVEINHGDGYITRYGHNNANLVKVGDMVTKGQRVALMGDTGRATGYHVHLEVFSNGKAVNPARYISRKNQG